MSKQLAEFLLKEKVISQAQFNLASEAAKSGKSYIQFLIEKKQISESKLFLYLSQRFGIPHINLEKFEIQPEVIQLVPPEVAKKHQFIPVQKNQNTLVVAICDPTHLAQMDSVKALLKMSLETVLTTFTAFEAAMSKHFGGAATVGAAIQSYQKDTKREPENKVNIELVQVHDIDSSSTEIDVPVIQVVNGILTEAIRRGASDIHVEPYEKRFRVRLRVDGTLLEMTQIPNEMRRAVIARFKVMSRMDLAESRLPQDGRIKLKTGGSEIDFRVNSMPTLFGEKIVLRALNKGNLQLDLMKLGFETEQLEVFKKGIYSPNGMVLVTGPTGSGKTTTLYSALYELNQVTENLSTAEDPVEYNLEGINQVQVNKDIGLTFANVLRALLRQDPDVILVGEIRDLETAEVAIQAALTGHLVLSTLHTNDAPSTITRLLNMGVEGFLVVSALNTIVAQRLLRTICVGCKEEQSVPKEKLLEIGFTPEQAQTLKFYKGKGCAKCGQTGYKGRVAIYEVFDFSPTLKEMVLKGENVMTLRKQAMQEGMKTLRMSALTKLAEGRTTLEEALQMTMEN